jgi:hypothetical protein
MIEIAKLWKEQYPRPSMKRDSFFSLDGCWLLNEQPIQVPFPPQSMASEYDGEISDELHYKKVFSLPEGFVKEEQHVLLHFGAVDQRCQLYLNGQKAGEHEGGYLPFTIDITPYLQEENLLEVKVQDDLNQDYPYGKQAKDPGGMWYTPVSGIWQSVWMEAVEKDGIENLSVHADMDKVIFDIESKSDSFLLQIQTPCGIFERELHDKHIEIDAQEFDCVPRYWNLDDPYLYHFTLQAGKDKVESYFALRSIEVHKHKGMPHIFLNKKPVFLQGVLDQGYFMDGIYLPQSPQEYEKDILAMKNMGFNFLRKHIKVEPELYYALCDQHGMLVMQDFVNSGNYDYLKDTVLPTFGFVYKDDMKYIVSPKRRQMFMQSGKETMELLRMHPSVIAYTIFNEGWGQFCADEMYAYFKQIDPSRLLDSTSGWYHQHDSDFDSLHIYFRNKTLKNKKKEQPLFLSECGGYTLPVENHTMSGKKTYGYANMKSEEDLYKKMQALFENMILPSIQHGLCGYIYTQLSDVEGELNGFLSYDRKVLKVDPNRIKAFTNQAQEQYMKQFKDE